MAGGERRGNFVGRGTRGGLLTSNGFHCECKKVPNGIEAGKRVNGDGAPIFIADRGISDP